MILAGLTLYLFWSDICYRMISNRSVLAVAAISLLTTGFQSFQLGGWLCVALVGCLLFRCNVMAGGDIKLMLAYLTGIRHEFLPALFGLMAVVGGLTAVVYLCYGWITGTLSSVRLRGVPYGIAIGAAGFTGVLLSAL